LEAEQKIFKDLNICSSSEIKSRTEVSKNNYEQTVLTESDVFLQICYKHIIPEAFNYIRLMQGEFKNIVLHGYAD
jgi:glutamine synthetase type III